MNKHFEELHQAHDLAKKCEEKRLTAAEAPKLVKYTLLALRKANTLMHHVGGFKWANKMQLIWMVRLND